MVSFSNVSYKNGRSKQRRIFWIAKKMLKRMETSAVPADIVDTVNKKAFRREQKGDFLLKARGKGRYNRTKTTLSPETRRNPYAGNQTLSALAAGQ